MGRCLVVAWVVMSLLLAARAASACTVCTNPNFRPAEDDAPRLRLGLGVKLGVATAAGVDLVDRRADLSYALVAAPGLELGVDVPVLVRTLRRGGVVETNAVPGDLELSVIGGLWSWRAPTATGLVRSERLSLRGGLKLPTAPVMRAPGAGGEATYDARAELDLPSVLQPGCSSVVPGLGISYALAADDWTLVADASFVLPIAVRDGPHTASSLRSALTFSLRATKTFQAIAGWTTRLEPSGELRAGVADANSGGFVGSVVVGARIAPVPTLALDATLFAPVAQILAGHQRLGPTYALRVEVGF